MTLSVCRAPPAAPSRPRRGTCVEPPVLLGDVPGIDLATFATVFGLIFLVELPDKTFIATLVMATRFRPLLVWVGVAAAFFVQTLVAVGLGSLLTAVPRPFVLVLSVTLFLVGGIILLRGASGADAEEAETAEEFGAKTTGREARGWKVVTLCFTIIFVAEWGDLSQLFTATMAAQKHDPVSVFLGAWLALATVSGLAALLGRTLLARIKLSLLRRIGGVVCLALATWTAVELLTETGVL